MGVGVLLVGVGIWNAFKTLAEGVEVGDGRALNARTVPGLIVPGLAEDVMLFIEPGIGRGLMTGMRFMGLVWL